MSSQLLRPRLRAQLTIAMRAKDRATVSALRSVLSALDNAEAVPVTERRGMSGSDRVAGAAVGVGASDVPRRELDDTEQRRLVQAEITEMTEAAKARHAAGDVDGAADLRRAAFAISALVDG